MVLPEAYLANSLGLRFRVPLGVGAREPEVLKECGITVNVDSLSWSYLNPCLPNSGQVKFFEVA